jgi:hypothetical protein
MTVDSLLRIMPPPQKPVEASGSWLHVEERLGVRLPDDFKGFIQSYGSGTINHFVSVLNPFSERAELDLLEQSKKQLDALRQLHDEFGERNPFNLFPSEGGLLPVAISDNGDVIHWITNGNSEFWTIVVNEARSPDYQCFPCNFTTFLTGILNKSIVCRAFPIGIFDVKPQFEEC